MKFEQKVCLLCGNLWLPVIRERYQKKFIKLVTKKCICTEIQQIKILLFFPVFKYLNVILLAAVNLSGKIFGKHNTFYCKHYCIFCSSIFEQLLYNILLLSVLFLSFLRTWISLTTFNYKNKINRTFFLFFRKIFIFSNLLFWNLKLQYAYHYAIDIHFFFFSYLL